MGVVNNPVIEEIKKAGQKSITGIIEIKGTDSNGTNPKHLTIALREGQIYAVHADGWVEPGAAWVYAKTGVDLSYSSNPLKEATEQETATGDFLIGGQQVSDIREKWGLALLAAALTWSKVSVETIKEEYKKEKRTAPPVLVKGEYKHGGKFFGKDCLKVIADVTSLIESFENNWDAVCRSMALAGIDPIPANAACPRLGVQIENNPLFDGTETIDGLAGRLGETRTEIVSLWARAVIMSESISYGLVAQGEKLWIPEHWQNPDAAYGQVRNTYSVQAAPEPEIEVLESDELWQPEWDEPEVEVELEPEIEWEPEPEIEWEMETELEPEPEWEVEAEPEPEWEVEEYEPEPEPEVEHCACGGCMLAAYVAAATNEQDLTLRESIAHHTVIAARDEVWAQEEKLRLAELEAKHAVFVVGSRSDELRLSAESLAEANDAHTAALTKAQEASDYLNAVKAEVVATNSALDIATATRLAHEAQVRRLQHELVNATNRAHEAKEEVKGLTEKLSELNGTIETVAVPALIKCESETTATYELVVVPAVAKHDEVSRSVIAAEKTANEADATRARIQDKLEAANREFENLLEIHDENGNVIESLDRDELLHREVPVEVDEYLPVEAVAAPTAQEISDWDFAVGLTQTQEIPVVQIELDADGYPFATDDTFEVVAGEIAVDDTLFSGADAETAVDDTFYEVADVESAADEIATYEVQDYNASVFDDTVEEPYEEIPAAGDYGYESENYERVYEPGLGGGLDLDLYETDDSFLDEDEETETDEDGSSEFGWLDD